MVINLGDHDWALAKDYNQHSDTLNPDLIQVPKIIKLMAQYVGAWRMIPTK